MGGIKGGQGGACERHTAQMATCSSGRDSLPLTLFQFPAGSAEAGHRGQKKREKSGATLAAVSGLRHRKIGVREGWDRETALSAVT